MLNTDKLKGLIVEKGSSQRKEAAFMGITEKTFYQKMKGGRFYHDELAMLAERLGLTDSEILATFYSRGAAS